MIRSHVEVHRQSDGRLFVQPFSRTEQRQLVANGLPNVLVPSVPEEVVGKTILDALLLARDTVLPARDHLRDPPDRQLLEWLGLRSFAEYEKGVLGVLVHGFYDQGQLLHMLVTPEDNGGPSTGFTPLREHRVTLTDFTPAVVGAAVLHALTLAT